MSDQGSPDSGWSEDPVVPPKKKSFPGWLLFCGAGCLLAMVLGLVGSYFLFQEAKKAMDPEAQWARLGESIELDARPPELNMMFGWGMGMDLWMIYDRRGYIAAIYDFGESEADGREEIFSEDFSGGGVSGLNRIEDPELGEVTVQGRTLPVVRLLNKGGFGAPGGQQVDGESAACFVDLTPEGDPGFQMLFLMRDPNASSEVAMDPISDEAIREFLLPFVVGPDREVYVAPPGTGPDAGFKGMIEAAGERERALDSLPAPAEECGEGSGGE